MKGYTWVFFVSIVFAALYSMSDSRHHYALSCGCFDYFRRVQGHMHWGAHRVLHFDVDDRLARGLGHAIARLSTLRRYRVTPERETSPIKTRLGDSVDVSGKSTEVHRRKHHTRGTPEGRSAAAQAYRTAAEQNEKGDYTAATWHSERALEYSIKLTNLQGSPHEVWADSESLNVYSL
jgi:hypothetical protein